MCPVGKLQVEVLLAAESCSGGGGGGGSGLGPGLLPWLDFGGGVGGGGHFCFGLAGWWWCGLLFWGTRGLMEKRKGGKKGRKGGLYIPSPSSSSFFFLPSPLLSFCFFPPVPTFPRLIHSFTHCTGFPFSLPPWFPLPSSPSDTISYATKRLPLPHPPLRRPGSSGEHMCSYSLILLPLTAATCTKFSPAELACRLAFA